MEEQGSVRFETLSREKRIGIVNQGILFVLDQRDKSDSKLREEKGNVKGIICERFKNGGELKSMYQQLEMIDLVWDDLIQNREAYKKISNRVERRVAIDKKMVELGVIEPNERQLSEEEIAERFRGDQEQQAYVDGIIDDVRASIEHRPFVDEVTEEVQNYASEVIPEQSKESKDDLDRLYVPGLLRTDKETGKKDMHYGRYSKDKVKATTYNYMGREIHLEKVGKLSYTTAFGVEDSMDEYLVITPEDQKEVFLHDMSFDKIDSIPEYRQAFLGELLSHDNLENYASYGYIGEVVELDHMPGNYIVDYSPERYTAALELKARLKEIEQAKAEDKDKEEEDVDK